MYTGTLIQDLLSSVVKAEQYARAKNSLARALEPRSLASYVREILESEQFTQTLCLGPADGNLALLFVIHAQLVRTLEPGHNLANPVYVHEIRAVSPPEQTRIQGGQ